MERVTWFPLGKLPIQVSVHVGRADQWPSSSGCQRWVHDSDVARAPLPSATVICSGTSHAGPMRGLLGWWLSSVQFSQFSRSVVDVWLFVTPWIAARQASLFITNSRSLLKLMSIESVMPSSHLILCRPLLLLPPIPPGIRVFSNESTPRMRWSKYWSFSFSISPSNEQPGLISFRMAATLSYYESRKLSGIAKLVESKAEALGGHLVIPWKKLPWKWSQYHRKWRWGT